MYTNTILAIVTGGKYVISITPRPFYRREEAAGIHWVGVLPVGPVWVQPRKELLLFAGEQAPAVQ
jgi:hypothetical protein